MSVVPSTTTQPFDAETAENFEGTSLYTSASYNINWHQTLKNNLQSKVHDCWSCPVWAFVISLTDKSQVVQHMETYWSILEKMPGSKLRLTKMDDEIYESLLKVFPDFDVRAKLDEDVMKSKSGKEQWRSFIMQYEKTVEDYNFGAMVRADASTEYEQDGTIFGE